MTHLNHVETVALVISLAIIRVITALVSVVSLAIAVSLMIDLVKTTPVGTTVTIFLLLRLLLPQKLLHIAFQAPAITYPAPNSIAHAPMVGKVFIVNE